MRRWAGDVDENRRIGETIEVLKGADEWILYRAGAKAPNYVIDKQQLEPTDDVDADNDRFDDEIDDESDDQPSSQPKRCRRPRCRFRSPRYNGCGAP